MLLVQGEGAAATRGSQAESRRLHELGARAGQWRGRAQHQGRDVLGQQGRQREAARAKAGQEIETGRILGGAGSMGGAALLAGRAALGAGAGRVWVDLLDEGAPRLDPVHPELMFAPTPADEERLASSTVVAGCGGGEAVAARLAPLLAQAGRLLLDADALNALAADPRLMQALRQRGAQGRPTLLTPHPLEAARLLGCSTAEVQADRLRAVHELADRSGAVVVLKGSGTLIGRPEPHHAPWINASGHAALATPGSGDVLAGWIAGLWSQIAGERVTGGSSAWDAAELAARRGVWLHGRRAERLAPDGQALVASRIVPDGWDG